jgi:hypothetical protein
VDSDSNFGESDNDERNSEIFINKHISFIGRPSSEQTLSRSDLQITNVIYYSQNTPFTKERKVSCMKER